jgi:hypothetical protein
MPMPGSVAQDEEEKKQRPVLLRRKRLRRPGPYSKYGGPLTLDGRTRQFQFVERARAELTSYLGDKAPDPLQKQLIERASMLMLRLAMLDNRPIKDGGQKFTRHDSDVYLAWSNTLRRTLELLGNISRGKPEKPQPANGSRSRGRTIVDLMAQLPEIEPPS